MKEDNTLEDVQIYEVSFHLLPSMPEEKLQETVLKLEGLITQSDGSIISEEFPKIRSLAYDIRKRIETKYLSFNKAYFGWIKFEARPSLLTKIENGFKGNEFVLRFLIIKTVKENTMQILKSYMPIKENNREEIQTSKELPKQEKVDISEEEIDKSIDELLVGEN